MIRFSRIYSGDRRTFQSFTVYRKARRVLRPATVRATDRFRSARHAVVVPSPLRVLPRVYRCNPRINYSRRREEARRRNVRLAARFQNRIELFKRERERGREKNVVVTARAPALRHLWSCMSADKIVHSRRQWHNRRRVPRFRPRRDARQPRTIYYSA